MAAVGYPPIEQLVPHKPPMILIDRMIETTDTACTCEVTITPQTLFIESAGVPAFVGLEYMAQAVAAYGGYKAYLSRATHGARVSLRHSSVQRPTASSFTADKRCRFRSPMSGGTMS